MPVHDWSIALPGTFHFFHQRWISALCDALNGGGLPEGYFAMCEQDANGPIPDVLALKIPDPSDPPGGVAVAAAAPRARVVSRSAGAAGYAARADRVAVHVAGGRLVSVIEIVSPGNKDSRNAVKQFVRKAQLLIRRGIHLLVVDLHRPGPRDPDGIHKVIWDAFREEPFDLPATQPFTVSSYSSGHQKVAYVDTVGVGEPLPDAPLFLSGETYVPCPLERTYLETWGVFPQALRDTLLPRNGP